MTLKKLISRGFVQFLILSIAAVCVIVILPSVFSESEGSDTMQKVAGLEMVVALTLEEKAWLQDHPKIKIAGPRSFPPFHYYEKDGVLKGMSVDYIRIILNSLGVEAEIQKDLPWPEVLKRAQNRELDLISCSAITSEREAYLSFSYPYLSFPLVIISRKNTSFIGGLDDLHDKKVAIIKSISTYEWLQRDNISIVPYFVNSPLQSLEAVSVGQVDAAIENLAAASYLIQKNGLTNLKVAAPTPYGNYNLHIAVRSDWPELVSIINKALAAVQPEQHTEIRNRWLSVRYEYGIQAIDILKWVMGVVAFSAIILTVVLIWNRRLQREIIERKLAEAAREKLIIELREAAENINALTGLLPICARCKKIRDDKGYWNQIETYIEKHSEAMFSHSVCPECSEILYSDTKWFKKRKAVGKTS